MSRHVLRGCVQVAAHVQLPLQESQLMTASLGPASLLRPRTPPGAVVPREVLQEMPNPQVVDSLGLHLSGPQAAQVLQIFVHAAHSPHLVAVDRAAVPTCISLCVCNTHHCSCHADHCCMYVVVPHWSLVRADATSFPGSV